MRRNFAAAAFVLAVGLSAGTALADPVTATSFVSFTPKSGRGIDLVQGFNTLAPAMTISCPDPNGCILSIGTNISLRNTSGLGMDVCTTVDGVDAKPVCQKHFVASRGFQSARQHAEMTQGDHTVETSLYVPFESGRVGNWEVDYTLYGK
ncbi:MAG TPA: hypothetical protein VG889_09950 [Rhizomicrobium sp.]|nr:hypothetical protein [Rhizomicrobium sp.]